MNGEFMDHDLSCCETLLNDLSEGVYFVDKNREITFWNHGAERITGFSSEEIVGKRCQDNLLNHVDGVGKQLCLGGCPLHETLQDGETRKAWVYLQHKDGHRVRVDIKIRPLVVNGEIVGASEVFSGTDINITSGLSLRELEQLALFDQLTQLPNRRYIDTFLGNQIRDFQLLGIPFGVMMMDLDLFKNVNDDYGHDVGDAVLRMIAQTFQEAMRRNDLIGRWGGEEFVAILRGVTHLELRTIAEKVRMLVERSSLKHANSEIGVTISIGATMVSRGDTAEEIIRRADRALYRSKDEGRNRVTVY